MTEAEVKTLETIGTYLSLRAHGLTDEDIKAGCERAIRIREMKKKFKADITKLLRK
jgi:hypothetical protein